MGFERKRVFITVKTYPTISNEYSELVCTAGIQEDGSWIRLYPVPFRKLELEQKFPLYTWVDMDVEKNESDFRPETYRPNLETIQVDSIAKPKTTPWEMRRKIILKNQIIYTSMSDLINKAKSEDCTSLAVFRPTEIVDFVWEEVDREWDISKLKSLDEKAKQLNLFQTPEEIENEFKVLPKVPYKFSYVLKDDSGKRSKMMVEEWQVGMLFFNCKKAAHGDEKIACEKVKEKYFDKYTKRELFFFLGTTKKFHNVAPNPFIIIGVFPPPFETENKQLDFLGDLT
jgi:hypothetical protein